jgi:hypothetical protein
VQLGGNDKWSAQPFNPMLDLFAHHTSGWIQNPMPPIKL